MTQVLRLREYEPKQRVQLTIVERDELARLVPGLVMQPEPGSTDTYTITSGSTVGSVRIGELLVELQPKIGPAAVLFLLSYSLDPRAWRDSHSTLDTSAPLTEAVALLFVDLVQRAIRRGLLHGYRQRDDTLATIRGRVRIADQLRVRSGLPLPMEVTYDDFTPDILENQVLLAALGVLDGQRVRFAPLAQTLTRLRAVFADVSSQSPRRLAATELQWTRLNEQYKPAVRLAQLILSNSGLEARAGDHAAQAVLVDMNVVFERFVRAALREALSLEPSEFPAPDGFARRYLDLGRNVRLKPDLTWWEGDSCLMVGDCKYKRPLGAIPNADVYQALAYVTAFDVDEAWLIYASGETEPRDLAIRQHPGTVRVRTVDASIRPELLLREIRVVAAELARSTLRGRSSLSSVGG